MLAYPATGQRNFSPFSAIRVSQWEERRLMSKKPPKLTGLGMVITLLSLFGLLLGACGDNTVTAIPPTATAAATSAVTSAATTTAASTTSASATTAATTGTMTGEIVIYAASSLTDPFNKIKADLEKA